MGRRAVRGAGGCDGGQGEGDRQGRRAVLPLPLGWPDRPRPEHGTFAAFSHEAIRVDTPITLDLLELPYVESVSLKTARLDDAPNRRTSSSEERCVRWPGVCAVPLAARSERGGEGGAGRACQSGADGRLNPHRSPSILLGTCSCGHTLRLLTALWGPPPSADASSPHCAVEYVP